MRKLVLAVALLLLPVSASAAQGDTLLTPKGTLHSIEVKVTESVADITTTAPGSAIQAGSNALVDISDSKFMYVTMRRNNSLWDSRITSFNDGGAIYTTRSIMIGDSQFK